MLEALEEENFKILPQKAYIRGFVKSFVKTLGGNQKEAIRVLEETHRYYFPEEYITSGEEEEILQSSELPSGNIVKATLTVTAILAIFAIGLFFFSTRREKTPEKKAATEQKSEKEENQTEDVSPSRINSKTPLKTGTPEPTKEEEVLKSKELAQENVEEAPEEPPQTAEETEEEKQNQEQDDEEKEDQKEEEITFRSFPENLYQYADVDHQEQVEEFIPQQMQTVVPNKENLFIRATEGKTWLAYKSDDKSIRTMTLEKGEFTLVRANTIRIFFGNIRAAKVFLNNKLIKANSRTGVKSLVFPENKKDQFKLPLFIFKDNGQVITSEEYQKQQAESN